MVERTINQNAGGSPRRMRAFRSVAAGALLGAGELGCNCLFERGGSGSPKEHASKQNARAGGPERRSMSEDGALANDDSSDCHTQKITALEDSLSDDNGQCGIQEAEAIGERKGERNYK